MQINQLFESRELTSYKRWKLPLVTELKSDFQSYQKNLDKWENRARIILLQTPLFTDFDSFRKLVESSEVREIDRTFAGKISGLSNTSSIASLKSLVGTYSSPRDIKRIEDGFKNNERIPMPIVLQGSKGYWMLSGNARCNTAFILGYKPKVIIINLKQESPNVTENIS